MPRLIEVPEIGEFEFPDDFTDDQIRDVLDPEIARRRQRRAALPKPAPVSPVQPVTPTPEPSSWLRRLTADPALALLQGVAGIPEAAIGLADIPTLGAAGRAVDVLAEKFPGLVIPPRQTRAALEALKSPEQREATRRVQEAEGFVPTVTAAIQNPSTIVQTALESIPSMLAGGAVGRVATRLLPAASRGVQTARAAGIGEGLVSAGQQAESIRQQTPTGYLTPKQAALAATAGVVTGLIGRASAGLARYLGIDDFEALASGGVSQAVKHGILTRGFRGMLQEGLVEELPQSAQEQWQQNLALGRPWDEGVAEAAATGMLAGAAMGAGAAITGPRLRPPPDSGPEVIIPPVITPIGDLSPAAQAAIRQAQQEGAGGMVPPDIVPTVPPITRREAEAQGRNGIQAIMVRYGVDREEAVRMQSQARTMYGITRDLEVPSAQQIPTPTQPDARGGQPAPAPVGQPPSPKPRGRKGIPRGGPPSGEVAAPTAAPVPQTAEDKASYEEALRRLGMTAETYRLLSETGPVIPMPETGQGRVEIKDSPIEGQGAFAAVTIPKGDTIAIAEMPEGRTPLGRYVNHSANPNAVARGGPESLVLDAIRSIKKGQEITVDYVQVNEVQKALAAARIPREPDVPTPAPIAPPAQQPPSVGPLAVPSKPAPGPLVEEPKVEPGAPPIQSIVPAIKWSLKDGSTVLNIGQRGQVHATIQDDRTPTQKRDSVESDLGFVNTENGQYLTKTELGMEAAGLRKLLQGASPEETADEKARRIRQQVLEEERKKAQKVIEQLPFEPAPQAPLTPLPSGKITLQRWEKLDFDPNYPDATLEEMGVSSADQRGRWFARNADEFKGPNKRLITVTLDAAEAAKYRVGEDGFLLPKEMAESARKPEQAAKLPETGIVDTLAGRMSLTEFERKGYAPEQVTRQDWINLQRAERRRLGQQEGGDSPLAPWAEYEEFHREAVRSALARDEAVDPQVLEDYPDLVKLPEPAITEKQITDLAESKNIPWNYDPAFMDFTEKLTGKRLLSELSPEQRATVYEALKARVNETPQTPQQQGLPPTQAPVAPAPTPPTGAQAQGQVRGGIDQEIRRIIYAYSTGQQKAADLKKLATARGLSVKQMQEAVEFELVRIADEVARNPNETSPPDARFNGLARYAAPTEGASTIEQVEQEIRTFLGLTALPPNVSVISDPSKPFGAVIEGRNKITLNATQIAPGTASKVLLEEGLHGVWFDPAVQQAWQSVRDSVTAADIAAERAKRAGLDTSDEVLREEAAVAKLTNRSTWKRLLDAIIAAFRRVFGLRVRDTDLLRQAAIDFLRGQRNSLPGRRLIASNAVVVAPGVSPAYSVVAYHGTPHGVTQFTVAKVGTGEGAQVYGWGLYFAQEQQVARQYADKLAGRPTLIVGGTPVIPGGSTRDADATVASRIASIAHANAGLGQPISSDQAVEQARGNMQASLDIAVERRDVPVVQSLRDQLVALDRFVEQGMDLEWRGNLYTVTLNVNDDELLDWDKPLSGQSEKVKRLLAPVRNDQYDLDPKRGTDVESGATAYARIDDALGGQKQASEYLASLGIKGIRYLDQGSRGIVEIVERRVGGKPVFTVSNQRGEPMRQFADRIEAEKWADSQRTYNYVIFSDSDITITARNGEAVPVKEAMDNPDVRFAAPTVEPEQPPRIATQVQGVPMGRMREVEHLEPIRQQIRAQVFDRTAGVNDEQTAKARELFRQSTDPSVKATFAQNLRNDLGGVDAGPALLLAELVDYGYDVALQTGDTSFLEELVLSYPDFEVAASTTTAMGRGLRALQETRPLFKQLYEIEREMAEAAGREVGIGPDLMRALLNLLREHAASPIPELERRIRDMLEEQPETVIQEILRRARTRTLRNWLLGLAKKRGFRQPTPDEMRELIRLDRLLDNRDLSMPERAILVSKMNDIFRRMGLPPSLLARLAANFVATLLTGFRTLTVNVFAPITQLFTERVFLSISNPKELRTAWRGMSDGWRSWLEQVKFGLKHDAYEFMQNEYQGATNHLKTIWEEGLADMRSKSKPRAAKGAYKLAVGAQQYWMRLLQSVDQANMARRRDMYMVLYGSELMKRLGLGPQKIRMLVDASDQLKAQAYQDAKARGLSDLDASVVADSVTAEQVQAWIANETGRPTQAAKAARAAENDAYSIVGRRAPGIAETDEGGLFSRYLGVNRLLEMVNKMRGDNDFNPAIAVSIFGYLSVPIRTMRFLAWNSPYGLLRVGIHHWRKSHRLDNWWKQSMATQEQEKQRLRMAIVGSVGFVVLSAIGRSFFGTSADDDDEEWGLYATGKGPRNKQLRDAWTREGFAPNSIVLKTGFPIDRIQIPMDRVGEPLAHLFWLLSARDDYAWRKKEAEATGKQFVERPDQTAAFAIGTYLNLLGQRGFLQQIGQLGQLTEGGGLGRAAGIKAGEIATASVTPFLGLQNSIDSMFNAPVDRSSVQAAVFARLPVLSLFSDVRKRQVNRLGDPLYDQSWFAKSRLTGIPFAFRVEPTSENRQLYSLLVDKGAAPSEVRRGDLEERFGPMTDDQFAAYIQTSGREIKKRISGNLGALQQMPAPEVKDWITQTATAANKLAAVAAGLSVTKPARPTTPRVGRGIRRSLIRVPRLRSRRTRSIGITRRRRLRLPRLRTVRLSRRRRFRLAA